MIVKNNYNLSIVPLNVIKYKLKTNNTYFFKAVKYIEKIELIQNHTTFL